MEKQSYSSIQEGILQDYSKISKKRIKKETKEEEGNRLIEKYLLSTREQLVVLSSKYDKNFMNDVINSIFEDETEIKVGNKYLKVKEILTQFMPKDEVIVKHIKPYIETYIHMFKRIDSLYKEEYEASGLDGIIYITNLLPEILYNSQQAYNMPKEDLNSQVDLIKRMLAFKYNIYTNSDEIKEIEDFNEGIEQGILKEQEIAKKEWKYLLQRIK